MKIEGFNLDTKVKQLLLAISSLHDQVPAKQPCCFISRAYTHVRAQLRCILQLNLNFDDLDSKIPNELSESYEQL